MLSQEDLKQIGEVVEQKVDAVFDRKFSAAFDAAFERSFTPAFDQAFDRKFPAAFDEAFDRKFPAAFDQAFDRKLDAAIEQKIVPRIGMELGQVIEQNLMPVLEQMQSDMVTKWYLDDKLADLKGDIIIRERKQDKKVNLLTEFLRQTSALKENHAKQLNELEVFPPALSR